MNQLSAQSIQTDADQHHRNWQQPSEGVIIAQHADDITRYAAAGLTREGGFKPNEKTLFEIGSITKVFTAILLAEAVRENKANFSDAVSTHLPGLKFKKTSPFHTITLSELATHTSGLPRLPVDLANGADNKNPYVHYDDQRLTRSLIAFRKNQLEQPGNYSYSNYGMGILGYVLTKIFGQTYRDLLKEKILDPLGMDSTDVLTRFTELPEKTLERMATPHVAGQEVSHWEMNSLVGAGGLISTAEDLVRFGLAHWDVQTPPGLAASLVEVAQPRLDHQGLGWSIDGDNLSHSGGTGGFRTELKVNPKAKTGRVFFTNSSGASHDIKLEGDFTSIEGFWSGVLNKDSGPLRLVFFIGNDGRAVVYSIDQGNQAILSATSRFVNDQYFFSFPSIEGRYKGKLEDGQLVGTLTQSDNYNLPLHLKHSNEMPDYLRGGLDATMSGDLRSLAGYWWGYLGGKKGLFIYLKITTIGELSIFELFSPDQQNEAIMISSASLDNRKLKFQSKQVSGKFSGKLARDRKSIKGFWKQGLLPTPLTLYLSEDKPKRE